MTKLFLNSSLLQQFDSEETSRAAGVKARSPSSHRHRRPLFRCPPPGEPRTGGLAPVSSIGDRSLQCQLRELCTFRRSEPEVRGYSDALSGM
jgi:hypothetical protein